MHFGVRNAVATGGEVQKKKMPSAPVASAAQQQNESSPERRISFGSEIALQHGIHFEAKYIGSMEMGSSRPGTRYEILAAMRRVRYEFKARNMRKRPVDLVISVDGIKVVLVRKRKKQMFMDESKMLVMSHPMYRIYYIAHDSYDPQIFCYVARDGASNSFKCNVFKCPQQDQAMAVVRTVGQAFELCNRLSQEQNKERQLLEDERATAELVGTSSATRKRASIGQESSDRELERRGGDRGDRDSSSSAQNSPKTGQQRKDSGSQKRHSIFMPKRMTADERDDEEEEENNESERSTPEETVPSTSMAARQSIVLERVPAATLVQSQPAEYNTGQFGQAQPEQLANAVGPSTSTSSAFPFQPAPSLWNIPMQQQQQHPFLGQPIFQQQPSIPSAATAVDPTTGQPFQQQIYSMVPPTVSIHSPLMLSPYATLQLPAASLSMPSTSSEATLLLNDLSSPGNSEAQRQLIRAHLEQAQQQAQVAACQVQLLRDQLNTETTARLEAQSKTHQLLNSNRELLEQVQQLVGRLQVMENRMSEGLMNHLHTNDVRHEKSSSSRQTQNPPHRKSSMHPEEPDAHASTSHHIESSQLRPCQLKPLRTSSLQGDEQIDMEQAKNQQRQQTTATDSTDTDDSGGDQRTSGGQAAKAPPSSLLRRLVPSTLPGSSVLALGMPLLLGPAIATSRTSPQQPPKRKDSHPFVHSQPPPYRPPNDVVVHHGSTQSAGSGLSPSTSGASKKSLRRFSLQQASEFDPAELHHHKRKPHTSKGIFGQMEFKRMSFNTNPNKKSSEDKSLINVPEKDIDAISGEALPDWPATERRGSRASPEKKHSGSPGAQRRSSQSSLIGSMGRK